ncbi:MAG: HD domain-containing protein [Oscillospiraceae bacterium]
MDDRRRSMALLQQGDWGEDTWRIDALKDWRHYPVLLEAIRNLQVEALYKSTVHGSGHINRVLLLAGLIASMEELEEPLLRQYLAAVSYHDVGRIFDGLDWEHGLRSAEQLGNLTGYRGENLRELQGAVAAHSFPDEQMEARVMSYAPQNKARAIRLAELLKDADNLDRVRLGDMNPRYLRNPSAKALAEFTGRLFQLDQQMKTMRRNK